MHLGTAHTQELLPTGGTLTRAQWATRHAVLTGVLAAHLPVLLLLGTVRQGPSPHALLEVLVPAAALLAARSSGLTDLVRCLATSFGLVVCSALLVHLSGGSIEAHFHFFLVVSAVACYQRWSALLLAVAFTVTHHVVLSAVDPALVFDHLDAEGTWWVWSLVHAAAITAQCVVALGHWRVQEHALAAERQLARELVQREAALQEALRRAEVDTLASGVAHGLNTPVQYAADNARYLGAVLHDHLELAVVTSAALEEVAVQDCEPCLAPLRPVLDRHRRLRRDCDEGDVRQALSDCLSGLDEVSRLALQLQEDAGRPPAAAVPPRPRSPESPSAAAPV